MKQIEPFIEHILEAIDKANRFTDGMDFETFLSDEKTQEALIRQFELIGEAVGHLDETFSSSHPEIPWRDIKSMRNHLIHEYWDIDLRDVWETLQVDIPVLQHFFEEIHEPNDKNH